MEKKRKPFLIMKKWEEIETWSDVNLMVWAIRKN